MSQSIHQHVFDNGITLLAEEMPWLESAAFAFLLPCGAVHDPPDRLGLSNLLCDMVQRGSGKRSSREFVEALERLGVDRSASVSLSHTSYSGATLADNLFPALELHADLLRRPRFPESQMEEARQVCFQSFAPSKMTSPSGDGTSARTAVPNTLGTICPRILQTTLKPSLFRMYRLNLTTILPQRRLY